MLNWTKQTFEFLKVLFFTVRTAIRIISFHIALNGLLLVCKRTVNSYVNVGPFVTELLYTKITQANAEVESIRMAGQRSAQLLT